MNDRNDAARQIDALLPQTHCEQCGYPGCFPYAQAIANGEADINQCPPGGQAGVDALAQWLNRPSKALNREHGEPQPARVAWIDEAACIGCTKCIQACPVDAIVGARQLMHTVISETCTGCDLCLAPCPVDCIEMRPTDRDAEPTSQQQHRRDQARLAYQRRNQRLARRQAAETERRARRRAERQARQTGSATTDAALPDRDQRRAVAQAALERARARRQAKNRSRAE